MVPTVAPAVWVLASGTNKNAPVNAAEPAQPPDETTEPQVWIWEPFQDLVEMQQRMDQLFNHSFDRYLDHPDFDPSLNARLRGLREQAAIAQDVAALKGEAIAEKLSGRQEVADAESARVELETSLQLTEMELWQLDRAAQVRAPKDGLLTDRRMAPPHIELGRTHRRCRPIYTSPVFIGSQALSALGLAAGMFLCRRRKRHPDDPLRSRARHSKQCVREELATLDRCLAAGDAEGYVRATRSTVQHRLSAHWDQPPQAISAEDICRRLSQNGVELARLFAEADAASYTNQPLSRDEMECWREILTQELNQIEASS